MNGMSCSELFCLFCCPPFPSRIAAKLAFHPPPPTYSFIADETGTKFALSLSDRVEWLYSQRELDSIEVFYTRTPRGNRIACMFVRCTPDARFTILFSHGNATDLGRLTNCYIELGSLINCNIFSYDYSGYGLSTGKPCEKNLYADVDAAWHALRTRYGISPENIILYGQSIGTVPTVDLASRYEVGAVILHSPLTSGMRLVFPSTKRTWFFDAFPNIDKVSKITSPVLVIHGTDDEVIDFSHGLAVYENCPRAVEPLIDKVSKITSPVLVIHGTDDEVIDFSHGLAVYENCPRAVEPLWVEGAGHNDVECYEEYLHRLKNFITMELVN